ncbi:hypothetical protein NDU88_004812 [Pleurodeles waltl]|uniref:Uncharacterized protein n=1 Tax=Pleurodeles waltl TaxID=8319 RepID=A0AAV7T958_PLEWA|nr:hypothetical protein NDU88_004812 [Pleurodeles waltl]
MKLVVAAGNTRSFPGICVTHSHLTFLVKGKVNSRSKRSLDSASSPETCMNPAPGNISCTCADLEHTRTPAEAS